MPSISAVEIAGKFLRVDMTTGKITEEQYDETTVRQFLGGTGLGAKIMYDEVGPEVKPFDPENLLIFSTGIATGVTAPGTCLFGVQTKGPLTGLFGASQANGYFGLRLKQAGFGGIIVQGKSDTWKYLYIENGKAELRDAEFLVGKTTFETEDALKEIAGTKKSSVACIGQGGENLVYYAGIEADKGHVASSNGPGAVMGSKKLKAIIAFGDYKIEPADPAAFKENVKTLMQKIHESPPGKMLNKLGTQSLVPIAYKLGYLPIKNLSTYDFPEYVSYDAAVMKQQPEYEFKNEPCYSCPIAHCNQMTIKEGKYAGQKIDEPEYEGWQAFSGLIGVTDIPESAMMNTYVDATCIDLKETGYTIAWAIECYEKGIITKADTDGLELTWGNVPEIWKLLDAIVYRKGAFGNLLADGLYRAAHKFGEAAVNCAVYCKKGQAPHIHDPRGNWGVLFAQSVSDASNMYASTDRSPNPALGYETPIPMRESKAHPYLISMGTRKNQFNDSFMTCFFVFTNLKDTLSFMNPLIGWDMTEEEALNVGQRIAALLRAYNIRHGLTPADDIMSPRLRKAPEDGPIADGLGIGDTWEEMKKVYYKDMGWDPETSKPLPETLKKLGIEYVAKDLY